MQGFSFALDWLRFTVPMTNDNPPGTYFPPDGAEWVDCKPFGSYDSAVRSTYCTMLWHSRHPEFMVLIEFTGLNLSDWRNDGHTDDELIQWVHDENGKPTRVDFALDILGQMARAKDFSVYWNTPMLETPVRTMRHIEGMQGEDRTGDTVYIGSRQSERMMRVYDKGLQTLTNLDWVRCELEFKGMRAIQMAEDMQKHGVKSAGMSHMRQLVTATGIKWFEDSFREGVDIVDIGKIGRRETNHERWLREVCIPAIVVAVENGTEGILEALEAILKSHEERHAHGPRLLPRQGGGIDK